MKILPIRGKNNRFARRGPQNGLPARAQQQPVFSYYANRSPDISARSRAGVAPQEATSRRAWHHPAYFMAVLTVLVGITYILSLNTNPKIILRDTHHVVAIRNLNTYQQAARDILASSWVNRNKLTIDSGRVVRTMKQQFPELADVAVTLPITGHSPIIEIATVQPALALSAQNGLFIVASNGKAVAAANEAKDTALKTLPVVTDNSGMSLQTGKAALTKDTVVFIQNLVAQLQAQKLVIQTLNLPVVPNELDVRLEGLPYYIKFNSLADVRQQVGAFLVVKQRLEGERTVPAEYVDVRVEEKVFYK